ncbi:MAG TPA: hypothetical protein VGH38_06515, partial [Bryobacteraceae bacterium]
MNLSPGGRIRGRTRWDTVAAHPTVRRGHLEADGTDQRAVSRHASEVRAALKRIRGRTRWD